MKTWVLKRATAWVILFLFTTHFASAQSVAGRITDQQSQPVEFANILLLSSLDSSFVQGAVSNADGRFQLPVSEAEAEAAEVYILKVSSVGYQTVSRPTQAGKAADVILPTDAVMLGEAVATAKLPEHRIKDGSLVTNIENSVLSQSGTANDVLKYIPGVQGAEGEFKVFGKGTPLIYINGREMRDPSELDRLSSADIRQVEVITNPGARFDANVKSVIRIKTVRRTGEGVSFEARSTWKQSQNTDLNEQLNLNYRRNNLDLFGTFQYVHDNSQLVRQVQQHNYADTLWQQTNRMEEHSKSNNYRAELGANYQIDDNHSLGGRYSVATSPKNKVWYDTESDIFANNTYYDYLLSNSYSTTAKRPAHQASTYYAGTFGKLSVDFNADLLSNSVCTTSQVVETSREQESRIVNSTNAVDNTLFAGKLVLAHPLAGGNFSLGSEYVTTHRTDLFVNPEEILPTTDSRIKECRASAFAEYSRFIRIAYLSAGLRYEHVSSERIYNNFYPNLSLATQLGRLQTQLSYTAKTKRPSYSQLSSNMSYMNRFTYMNGNPALRPETIHDITLSGSYKWFQFMISYQREKDAILYITEQYEKNPAITIITHRNFDRIDNFSTFLVAAPSVGWWQPRLTVGLQKQWANVEYNGTTLAMNRPLYIASFNNGLSLPYGWTFTLNMSYQSKGDYQNVYINKSSFELDASLSKSVFNDRLSLNLQAIDLARGRKDGNLIYNKHMDMDVYNTYDSREIRLTLRYKFNTSKSNYKGKGAANEEIRRL